MSRHDFVSSTEHLNTAPSVCAVHFDHLGETLVSIEIGTHTLCIPAAEVLQFAANFGQAVHSVLSEIEANAAHAAEVEDLQ